MVPQKKMADKWIDNVDLFATPISIQQQHIWYVSDSEVTFRSRCFLSFLEEFLNEICLIQVQTHVRKQRDTFSTHLHVNCLLKPLSAEYNNNGHILDSPMGRI